MLYEKKNLIHEGVYNKKNRYKLTCGHFSNYMFMVWAKF